MGEAFQLVSMACIYHTDYVLQMKPMIMATVFISVPDNTVQTADLLVGVGGLIIEGHVLLEKGPTLLHSCPGLPRI